MKNNCQNSKESAPPASAIYERRGGERRSRILRAIVYGLFRPRRRRVRRADPGAGYYVDWYSPPLLLSALGVVVCCFTDAVFTLALLGHGARELNPFMDALIQADVNLFIRVKYLLTCLCVLFLVLHKNFFLLYRFRVEHVVHACFATYVALICYEVSLLLTL